MGRDHCDHRLSQAAGFPIWQPDPTDFPPVYRPLVADIRPKIHTQGIKP
jgi:hypothetical protein